MSDYIRIRGYRVVVRIEAKIDMADMASESGCAHVLLGEESGSRETMDEIRGLMETVATVLWEKIKTGSLDRIRQTGDER